MAEPVVVDLLRHGEVEGARWAFRGSTDVALSAEGLRQMCVVGDAVAGESFTRIATSPLQRCRLFAESLSESRNIHLDVLPDIQEMNFGEWEGRGTEDVDPDFLQQFWASPVGFVPPGGECFDDFADRVIESWSEWLKDADGEHRLLIAHGGVIRVLLAHLSGLPLSNLWRLYLPYASWSRVSLLKGEHPRLLFMNR